jgi:hypothetical protein
MTTHKVSNGEFGVAVDGSECTCSDGDTCRILGGDLYETVRGSVDPDPVGAPVRAVWHIHLFADCPRCLRTVDFCEASDWWTDGSIEPLEQGTPKADDYDVTCTRCGHDFRIKCEW